MKRIGLLSDTHGCFDEKLHRFFEDVDEIWQDYNGGNVTYRQYKALPESEQKEILDFIADLPYTAPIKIRSKKYLLVHAGLDCKDRLPGEHLLTTVKRQQSGYPKDMLWIREDFFLRKALPSYTVVFGHTPTRYLSPYERSHSIWRDGIFKDKIGIDCGCYGGGRLAALRLDDLEEFYVQSKLPRY